MGLAVVAIPIRRSPWDLGEANRGGAIPYSIGVYSCASNSTSPAAVGFAEIRLGQLHFFGEGVAAATWMLSNGLLGQPTQAADQPLETQNGGNEREEPGHQLTIELTIGCARKNRHLVLRAE